MIKTTKAAEGMIYLEDGTVFKGKSFGAVKTAVGELVFNTWGAVLRREDRIKT